MRIDPIEKARLLRVKAGLTLDPRTADVLRVIARNYEAQSSSQKRQS
jgi:hypothetical protein